MTRFASGRPNILLIQTDAQHHGWWSRGGGLPGLRTPNLERLADRGTTFTDACTVSGVCVPSRVSLMTGRYPIAHGVTSNNIARYPATEPSFSRMLRSAGYRTGYFGKSHFAGNDADMAADGWDISFGKPAYDAYLASHGVAVRYPEGDDIERLAARYWNFGKSRIATEHYFDRVIAREAARFIAADRDEPFLCYLSHVAPHGPFTPPGHYAEMYRPQDMVLPERCDAAIGTMPAAAQRWIRQNQKYLDDDELRNWLAMVCGLVALVDDNVGMLLDALEASGQLDNTLILYTSDHGDFAGRYGILGKSWAMTEDLLRIPLIISAPETMGGRRGVTSNALVQSIDLTATMLDAAAVPRPEKMHGRSLAPVLADPARQHRDCLFAHDHSEYSGAELHMTMARTHRYKLVVSSGLHMQLHDLDSDPHEMCNLAADPAHAARLAAMKDRVLAWHLDQSGGFFEPQRAGFWEDETAFYDETRFCGRRIAKRQSDAAWAS